MRINNASEELKEIFQRCMGLGRNPSAYNLMRWVSMQKNYPLVEFHNLMHREGKDISFRFRLLFELISILLDQEKYLKNLASNRTYLNDLFEALDHIDQKLNVQNKKEVVGFLIKNPIFLNELLSWRNPFTRSRFITVTKIKHEELKKYYNLCQHQEPCQFLMQTTPTKRKGIAPHEQFKNLKKIMVSPNADRLILLTYDTKIDEHSSTIKFYNMIGKRITKVINLNTRGMIYVARGATDYDFIIAKHPYSGGGVGFNTLKLNPGGPSEIKTYAIAPNANMYHRSGPKPIVRREQDHVFINNDLCVIHYGGGICIVDTREQTTVVNRKMPVSLSKFDIVRKGQLLQSSSSGIYHYTFTCLNKMELLVMCARYSERTTTLTYLKIDKIDDDSFFIAKKQVFEVKNRVFSCIPLSQRDHILMVTMSTHPRLLLCKLPLDNTTHTNSFKTLRTYDLGLDLKTYRNYRYPTILPDDKLALLHKNGRVHIVKVDYNGTAKIIQQSPLPFESVELFACNGTLVALWKKLLQVEPVKLSPTDNDLPERLEYMMTPGVFVPQRLRFLNNREIIYPEFFESEKDP